MNIRSHASLLLLGTTLAFSTQSMAWNIVDLTYREGPDELVFKVLYQGTHQHRRFGIAWQECNRSSDGSHDILGILHSSDPDDPAEKDFERTVRISLAEFTCRPGTVAIGTAYHKYRREVEIPAAD